MKKLNKNKLRKINIRKIKTLFEDAESNPSKANKYVKLARKLAMKVNLPILREYKRKYCKHCYNYFMQGNYRVRTRNKMVVYYCFNCKKYMKFKI